QTLPPTTAAVLGAAALIRRLSIPLTIAIAVTIGAWRVASSTPSGRRVWHSLLLGVPFFGAIRRSASVNRSCAAVAALLESGVPIAAALSHAARAAGDAALAEALLAAREDVVHGERLSRALAAHDAATGTTNRLVHAGSSKRTIALVRPSACS